jgi:hypothetical protein
MSSKKITDLTSYSAAEISASSGTDLLFITDVANQETKKITAVAFSQYATSVGGAYTGSFTGSFTGILNGTSSWAQSASHALTASYAPSSGESNTASNTGSYGYGVVSDKVGVDLRFKKIGQGSNVIISPDPNDSNVLLIAASTTTTAGGSTGNIQFKSPAGTFSGNNSLTWDAINNNLLTIVGGVSATSFTSSVANAVGFLGTASFAISSSRAISSSNTISSSYSLSGSYCLTSSYSSRQDLGINSHTSPATINTYKNTKYTYTHSLGGTPSYFRCVLICTVNDTVSGYSQYLVGDEIESVAVYDSSSDNEHTAITAWTNTSFLGASFLNNGYLVNNKNTGDNSTLDPTKWKVKFYYA